MTLIYYHYSTTDEVRTLDDTLFGPVSQCSHLPSHEGFYISPPEEFSNSAFPSLLSWSFVLISCQDLTLFLELLH